MHIFFLIRVSNISEEFRVKNLALELLESHITKDLINIIYLKHFFLYIYIYMYPCTAVVKI